MPAIDLRSDFLAPPSAAMRAASAQAWDSRCFGLREDPWQQQLESRVAALLGMEDALIFPTCTMANTTALMTQAPVGSTVLVQPDAHVLLSEANAAAALAGVSLRSVGATNAWQPSLADWAEALGHGSDEQRATVSLCLLENTHNRAGGWALTAGQIDDVVRIAGAAGSGVHVDGARLLYAAAAQHVAPAALVAGCSSVALSLNKHTGSPIAAVLAGSRALIAHALAVRQRLGGGLRPVGAACAAALQGLAELHELDAVVTRTRRLAQALADLAPFTVAAPDRCTNLIVLQLPDVVFAERAMQAMQMRGLLAIPFGAGRMRLALHRGISDTQAEQALQIIAEVAATF